MNAAALLATFGPSIRLLDASIDDFVFSPGTATASWRLDADGGVYEARGNVSGGAFIKQYDWVIPNSAAPLFECTWAVGTGSVDSTPGAAGTWLALTGDRTWEEVSSVGFESATFRPKIRLVSGAAERTAEVTLSVESSP